MRIDKHVSFETLMPGRDGKGAYQLRAVVVHGGEADYGHYTSRVRALDNFWYAYDDAAQPKMRSTMEVLSVSAYILVYERF